MVGLDRIVRKLALGAKNIALGASLAVMLYVCDGCISKKQEPIVKENSLTAKLDNEKPADKEANADFLKEIKDLGRIYFVSDRDGQWDIYSMKPNGSDVRRLTNTVTEECNLAISPDGTRLAFDDMLDVYWIDVKSGVVRQLTSSEYDDVDPTWSPDGNRILFTRYIFSPYSEIYFMDVDNNGQVSKPKSISRHLTNNWPVFSARGPACFPDGKSIACFGYLIQTPEGLESSKNFNIYIVNVDNQGYVDAGRDWFRKITDDEEAFSPAVSPKSDVVAYVGYSKSSGSGGSKLFKINAEGTSLRSLVNSNAEPKGSFASYRNPFWSPCGNYLAFTLTTHLDNFKLNVTQDGELSGKHNVTFNSDIYITKAEDTNHIINLTQSSSNEKEPTWSN